MADIRTGYKATALNMCCRDTEYVLGTQLHESGEIRLCENGYHFTQSPLECFLYYNPSKSRYFSVTAEGPFDRRPMSDYTKIAAASITLTKEFDIEDLCEEARHYFVANGKQDSILKIPESFVQVATEMHSHVEGFDVIATKNFSAAEGRTFAVTIGPYSMAMSERVAISVDAASAVIVKKFCDTADFFTVAVAVGQSSFVRNSMDFGVAVAANDSVVEYTGNYGILVAHTPRRVKASAGTLCVIRTCVLDGNRSQNILELEPGVTVVFKCRTELEWHMLLITADLSKTIKNEHDLYVALDKQETSK